MSEEIETTKVSNLLVNTTLIPEEIKNERTIDGSDSKETKQVHETYVHLFYSFDIVNSTAYKERTAKWPLIMRELLNTIRAEARRRDTLSLGHLWRVIGDEIIFVLQIMTYDQLKSAVSDIFSLTQELALSLKLGKFFDDLPRNNLTNGDVDILKSQNTLSVKATAWIGAVTSEQKSPYDNICVYYDTGLESKSITEFLGQDIDCGFRLKSYTQDRRLCISVELAYLLLNNPKQEEIPDTGHRERRKSSPKLHIMDYVQLKGVWNDELYPVIWYYDEDVVAQWTKKMTEIEEKISFANSFRYNETYGNPIVFRYFQRKDGNYENKEFYSISKGMYMPDYALRKIVSDRNLKPKIEYLTSLLRNREIVSCKDIYGHPLELHCAVVCCNIEDKSIMITHRKNDRRLNPSRWEFGCAKATGRMKLEQTIVQYYREKFGVEILLVCDCNREERQPIPIAVYEIPEETNHIKKGIIFVAKVQKLIPEIEATGGVGHDEIRWIKESELEKYSPAEVVPDFHNTCKKVFKNFEIYFSSE